MREGDSEEEIMAEAAMINVKPEGIMVSDILGNSRILEGCEVERIDFMKHEAIMRKR